jgi:hypothetical protein
MICWQYVSCLLAGKTASGWLGNVAGGTIFVFFLFMEANNGWQNRNDEMRCLHQKVAKRDLTSFENYAHSFGERTCQ